MLIGEHMKVSGTIEGEEDLVVRGRVDGTVRIAGVLTVEPGGFVGAEVRARAAAIYGTVLGNVTASESIEVARSGQMVGDACAPRVSIVPGAGFRGRLEMGEIRALDSGALPALGASEHAAPPSAVAALPPRRAEPPVEKTSARAPSDAPAPVAAAAPIERTPVRASQPTPPVAAAAPASSGEPSSPSRDAAQRHAPTERRSLPRAGAPNPPAPAARGDSARQVPRLATPTRGPMRRR